ncbi:(Fe-S)-binding protein [Clostridium aciditolerans]|uniref:(Fe-S)-binding protein n=1 Tax=Clostridium aciditolerans TaxID=339861 RepID=A0A934HQI5_9CLOT|nr:(Fe-S)-binding protein [Clostridium aciditolerans]MBI6871413.1 (Fe-S)-binding protein [Clostridium aciditolerans]
MKKNIFYIDNESTIENIKQLMEDCINCKLCTKECEFLKEFSDSPKKLLKDILNNKSVDTLIPYSCNMCGICSKVCPKGLKLKDVFMKMRRDIAIKNNGMSTLKGHRAVHMHQKLSFSKAFSGLVTDENSKEVKRIFIPGCSLSAYSPELVHKAYNYLKEKLPGTALLIECCGKPTESLGEDELFKVRYKKLLNTIEKTGAEEVITACQSCYVTFSKYGLNQKIKSLWTVFQEIDLPKRSIDIGNNSDITFTIHDSCPTRDVPDIHDSIRWIMNRLNYKIEEMKYIKEKTRCCGTGGMVLPVNPEISLKSIKKIADEANTDYIVTYCASCREAMLKGQKKSLHVLDLIFGNTWTCKDEVPKTANTIISWCNRYKVKARGNGSE